MNLPGYFYWLIGVTVVANLSTLCTVLYMGFKVTWWASKVDHRIEDHHEKLDDHEEQIRQLRHSYQ